MKLIPVLLSLFVLTAQAEVTLLQGVVSKVQDGDTLALTSDKATYKVRLAEIDAPELKQSFGKEAKESLTQVAMGKNVTAHCASRDIYGRYICKVLFNDSDLAMHQMNRGMAWVYVGYAKKSSPMFKLEAKAKKDKTGLWKETSPVAPWVFRKQKTV